MEVPPSGFGVFFYPLPEPKVSKLAIKIQSTLVRWGSERDKMKINFKVWLEEDNHVLFGEGRRQLLQAIEENGSLARAAKMMNMSYRAAWGRLKASEKRLGFQLAEKEPEQGKKGGLHLTRNGKSLLDEYTRIHRAFESLVTQLERKKF
jgi:molybdate transport system regulatory protein